MKFTKIYKKILVVFVTLSMGVNLMYVPKAMAIDVSKTTFLANKTYNNLIEENLFTSIDAMSVDQIQSFLELKNSTLKNYAEGGRRASQIIWDASHAKTEGSSDKVGTNGIVVDESTGTVNPLVILATLEKEQSLITRTTADDSILRKAMGYGCLEGQTCYPKYYGFANQVDWAAWQLRYNFHRAEKARTTLANYKVDQTMTFDYSVTFANRATASLYRYTPHVFNGNYNFWVLFNSYKEFCESKFNGWSIPTTSTLAIDNSPITMSTYSSSLVAGTTCSISISSIPIGTNNYYAPCPDQSTKKITIIRHKAADINGDGKIDLIDLSIFASYWGKSKPAVQLANLNPDVDEEVNLLDLSILAANWGK